MIRLYDKICTSSPQGEAKTHNGSTGSSPPHKKFPLQKLLMPAILLALILVTAVIVNRSPSPPNRQSPPTPTVAPLAAPAIQPALSSAKQLPASKKAEETVSDQQRTDIPPPAKSKIQPQPTESNKGFIVRMKVTQGGTLTVTIDGSTSQAYDLIVGDSIEWKADRSVTLELSNSGGVELDLNGKALKSFGQSGKPAVVVLDSEGIRQ
jgi:hypothetical protein